MRLGCVRDAVTVTVRRTFPSGPAKPSRRTAASSRRRSIAGPPPPPNGPHTRDIRPGRHRSTPRPPACADGGLGATAWHDRLSSSTRHRAALPASAVHRSPHIPVLRPARHARTPRQRRPQGYSARQFRILQPLLRAYHQLQAEAMPQAASVAMIEQLRKDTIPRRPQNRSGSRPRTAQTAASASRSPRTLPLPAAWSPSATPRTRLVPCWTSPPTRSLPSWRASRAESLATSDESSRPHTFTAAPSCPAWWGFAVPARRRKPRHTTRVGRHGGALVTLPGVGACGVQGS